MCSVAGAYSNRERGEILSLEALNRAAFTSLPRETENFFLKRIVLTELQETKHCVWPVAQKSLVWRTKNLITQRH